MVCLILLFLSAAPAPVMLVELRGSPSSGKNASSLSKVLSKQHAIVAPGKLPRTLTTKSLRAHAKAAGAELLLRIVAHPGFVQIDIESTSGGTLASGRFEAKRGRLTKKGLAAAAQAVEDAKGQLKAAPVVEEQDAPIEVADETPAASAPGDELEELSDEEEYLEPEAKVVYTIKDGRRPLVATVGYAMLWRHTETSADDGTPPTYEGVLSPGLAFALSLFPRRFSEGGGVWRDFGVYARGVFAFMPTQSASGEGSSSVSTALALQVQAGLTYRHLFGDSASAVGLGAELGVVWDQVNVSSTLPFPSTTYVSPSLSAIAEVPFAKKRLVWVSRAGVMPITAIGGAQVAAFGPRQSVWGLHAATGLRSTFYGDYLYAELQGMLTLYWERHAGTGDTGFINPSYRDMSAGFQVLVGATY